MSTIGKIDKNFVSDINYMPVEKMYAAVSKRNMNNTAELWNSFNERDDIKVFPLTEEEIALCEVFDNFVISQRELPID
jgi:hypothetical protein